MFKIGHVVRVLKPTDSDMTSVDAAIGLKGIIIHEHPTNFIIKLEKAIDPPGFKNVTQLSITKYKIEQCLEHYFKIGDRVVVLEDMNVLQEFWGVTGTLTDTNYGINTYQYVVEFDQAIALCDQLVVKGHEIELLSRQPAEPVACVCDIMDLMARGCKCGFIELERTARGSRE